MITQTAAKNSILALTLMFVGSLSGCSSQSSIAPSRQQAGVPVSKAPQVRLKTTGERAAEVALQQVGVPYRYGGVSRSGFDCSGLVQYAYSHVGKNIPRTTGQLWSSTSTVARDNLRIGDLLFFRIEGKMSHVGMYIGGHRFVHAPSSGRSVSIANLTSPYYSSAFIRGGRPR